MCWCAYARWSGLRVSARNGRKQTLRGVERTGLASTDTLFKVLFALNRLDAFEDMLKAQLRLVKFPKTLEGDIEPAPKVVHRVRHKRSSK